MYDKNHYKLALGQINTARHLIEQVAKDYVRLIKFGDSLYRCKQLKRAALGRMATIMRRNKDPLAYLEQVRQHISRLPAIDPSTRTLVICGYPNVGKSSFINKVTRADVDVQPYAFTTKSLFVGHMDYKYLRWQVIDTPGILDHPLEEMNTIEMQAITALAHLRAAVMYFMDLSEQCGYTIEAQVQLFNSIKPLFANKPTFLVINKIDVAKLDDLDDERAALVRGLLLDGHVKVAQISTFTDEGIMELKENACETLLASRVEGKSRGPKAGSIMNRLHVATPQKRDDVERKPFIPQSIMDGSRKKYDINDPLRRKTEKDEQEEHGGAGVHNIDMKKNYLLANEDWKYDTIPEIYEGKNVADFIDPDIMSSLDKLEREEEKLEADGFYDESDGEFTQDDKELRAVAKGIQQRKDRAKLLSQNKKALQSRAQVPRKLQHRTLSQMAENMRAAGIDPSNIEMRAELLAKAKGLIGKRKSRSEEVDEVMDMDDDQSSDDEAGDSMSVEDQEPPPFRKKVRGLLSARPSGALTRGKSSTTASTNRMGGPISSRAGAARIPARNRQSEGLRDIEQEKKARSLHELGIRERNQQARAGESDRRIQESKPKWLFAGMSLIKVIKLTIKGNAVWEPPVVVKATSSIRFRYN